MIGKPTEEEIAMIELLIEAYLSSRRDELQAVTLKTYRGQFEQFLHWCEKQEAKE